MFRWRGFAAAPRTLTARQHAHSVLIHAICIPNLATAHSDPRRTPRLLIAGNR